jgi:hypothetical protein
MNMPWPGNNKQKATKKPGMRTATVGSAEGTVDVPDYFTCQNAYTVAANVYHQAIDKSEALRALWEIACSLRALGKFVKGKEHGFKEGKECGLEEGRKLGLEEGRRLGLDEGRKLGLEERKKHEEGDFNRMFNQVARQGKADERNWWVEAGHHEQDTCMRDTHSFISIGIGSDIVHEPDEATAHTHGSIGTQMTVDKLLPTKPLMPMPFSWAEDTASIPIVSSLTPTLPPRDFSALRSKSMKPFDTL